MNYTKEAGRSWRSEVGSRKSSSKQWVSPAASLRRPKAVGSRYLLTLIITSFLFISFSVNAQIAGKSIPEIRQEMNAKTPTFQYAKLSIFRHSLLHPPIFLSSHPPLQSMPKSYNYNNLALFCKIEVKLEKAVKLPIKFRLGEVEYVDKMEGKY